MTLPSPKSSKSRHSTSAVPPAQLSEQAAASDDEQYKGRAWIEIDLSALRQNLANITAILQPETELWAVVKANAYGHGSVLVAKTAIAAGVSGLCVATLQEGIELRLAGLRSPIMLFGVPLIESDVRTALDHNLEWTISDRQQISLCQAVATDKKCSIPIHLNVDTGMSRLGVGWQEAAEVWRSLIDAQGLSPLSLYSHFATADEFAHPATQQQAERFATILQTLQQQQISPPIVHIANSAATLAERHWHHHRVRIGLALYGYAPADFLSDRCRLLPVMSVKARITHLKTVPMGTGVSYGHRYSCDRPQTLATVAIGYADGVPRRLSGQLQGWVDGQRLQQVGNVTMDQTIWMVPQDANVAVGDVVDLFGEGWNAWNWADTLGTIPYEILCGFSTRLPRLAIDSD